jgi:ketosteroid isomerase-like protein
MGPDDRAIRNVHSTWIDAVNEGNLVCLLSLMADDVVFLNPGHRIAIYRKQPDGCWPLARDAHTLSPVAKLSS